MTTGTKNNSKIDWVKANAIAPKKTLIMPIATASQLLPEFDMPFANARFLLSFHFGFEHVDTNVLFVDKNLLQ